MGLPKAHRLKHHRDFRSVYERGKTYSQPHLILKVLPPSLPNSDLSPSQLGIAVSQKVSKKAVLRNRFKRQLRSVLRRLLPRMKPGFRGIIVVKRNASECNYELFLRELEQLLIKAEIIHGH